jgi:3-hydroxyacyl-CoA dehydrogenase
MADAPSDLSEPTVAVIGAGSIGAAFALVFAASGRKVRLQDHDPARRAAVGNVLRERLQDLESFGLTSESIAMRDDVARSNINGAGKR